MILAVMIAIFATDVGSWSFVGSNVPVSIKIIQLSIYMMASEARTKHLSKQMKVSNT